MDPDPYKYENKNEQEKNIHNLSNDGDVSKPNGVRRSTIDPDQINRFLVECQFGFIFPCSIFLWIIFLLFW